MIVLFFIVVVVPLSCLLNVYNRCFQFLPVDFHYLLLLLFPVALVFILLCSFIIIIVFFIILLFLQLLLFHYSSSLFCLAEVFDIGDDHSIRLNFANLKSLSSASAILLSLLLGLALSILFFIDQNISAALVDAPSNRLQKGEAYHWDLLVVAILNIFLSLLGLPWMHGILPHSPMHARALADVVPLTDSYSTGIGSSASTQYLVVRVRETRVTGVLIHILIILIATLGLSLIKTIPVAVLSGLLLFCAINTLRNNTLYQRILLLFTQQASFFYLLI